MIVVYTKSDYGPKDNEISNHVFFVPERKKEFLFRLNLLRVENKKSNDALVKHRRLSRRADLSRV